MILVTGANGFLGSALSQSLAARGYEYKKVVRRACPGAISVGNIDDQTAWGDALSGVTMVVHLAARVHVMHDTVTNPLAEFRKVNAAGTERLARSAAAAGVQRFVFVSSIKVNGEKISFLNQHAQQISANPLSMRGSLRPFSEDDAPNPQDTYAVSKWEAEQVLRQIAQETGMEVVIIRPPLVYGPRVGANFLKLLKLIKKGMPLPFGLIDNQRSLIYVGNLVDAIITCLEHPAAAGQTYLVSDGEDVSTPELINRMASALECPARLLPVPPALLRLAGRLTGKSAEVERLLDSLVIDSSKIRRELGWTPPFTMGQGLRETADWYLRTRVDT